MYSKIYIGNYDFNFLSDKKSVALIGLYAEILKGGLVGNPKCGDLGVQLPDADKIVIL